jgi:uncharacterized membrane protein (UPF0127 family)
VLEGYVIINGRQWQVSIAYSYFDKATGLGNLSEIPSYTGMLFWFDEDVRPQVTTDAMLFDLDIVFISSNLRVVEVYQNVRPNNRITPADLCRYFMEVNSGEAASVCVGDSVTISIPQADTGVTPSLWQSLVAALAPVVLAPILKAAGKWVAEKVEMKS